MSEHDEKQDKPKGPAHCACEEQSAGAPEWLVSYADNLSLLLAFFVILLAMNLKEDTSGGIGGKEEFGGQPTVANLDLALAIRSAFNNPVSANSTIPNEQRLVQRIRERSGHLGNAVDQGQDGQYDAVEAQAPTEFYVPSGVVEFAFGSSAISAVGREHAEQVAAEIHDLAYVIEVRGHASPFEVFRNEREGMHLSFERALAVADALVAAGVPWDNLHVVAVSDGVPLGDRATTRAEGERHQVVEIVTTARRVREGVGGEAHIAPGMVPSPTGSRGP